MKKTLVIGASTNESRYSNVAIQMLVKQNKDVVAIGLKKGTVAGIQIESKKVPFKDIDTITLYVSPKNQPSYYDYILSLQPNRVIFNPGTENPELYKILKEAAIKVEIACTLVLLSTNQYESQKGDESINGE